MTTFRQLSLYHRGQTRLIGKPMPAGRAAELIAKIYNGGQFHIDHAVANLAYVEDRGLKYTLQLPTGAFLSAVKVTP